MRPDYKREAAKFDCPCCGALLRFFHDGEEGSGEMIVKTTPRSERKDLPQFDRQFEKKCKNKNAKMLMQLSAEVEMLASRIKHAAESLE